MSIINLLNQIQNDEIVLPAIQWDFVWSEDKVQRLLDSIMRGYHAKHAICQLRRRVAEATKG